MAGFFGLFCLLLFCLKEYRIGSRALRLVSDLGSVNCCVWSVNMHFKKSRGVLFILCCTKPSLNILEKLKGSFIL